MRQVTSLRYYATVTSHEQEATEAKYVKVCQASFVLCCLGSEKVAMILLFWQVLGEIAESVLSLEAVQDEIIWFIPHLHLVWTGLLTEYSLQLDDLHVYVYENPRLVFIPYSRLFSWGANFRYFCGQPTRHVHVPDRILRSGTCAVQSQAD